MKILISILILGLLGFSFGSPIWPDPSNFNRGLIDVSINPSNFSIQLGPIATKSGIIQRASSRYLKLFFPVPSDQGNSVNQISKLVIEVDSEDERLFLGVDESYTLIIPSFGESRLYSKTVFGAIRGLESFSQLIQWDEVIENTYGIANTPIEIEDYPRFPWRGLLIDTSRHYLPMKTLYKFIDALSYHKMNVFHWHIIDAQSFPLQSERYPLLSEKGAYTKNAIYTKKEIKDLIQYAKDRGVRVVPEFDTPGHTLSWGKGYPEVLADCPFVFSESFKTAMTPIKNFTYEIVEGLFQEMSEVFEDEYYHNGGDEVQYSCWRRDPEIREYKRQTGMTDEELFRMYWNRLLEIMERVGKKPISWEEVYLEGLNPPSNNVIHVWTDKKYLADVVKGGYQAILSAGWYLDQQIPGKLQHYFWQDTWKDFYNNEPFIDLTLTDEEKSRVLGGEGCMWGEKVDEFNIESQVFPRASAIAERLWTSPAILKPAILAEPRLSKFRCRLVNRGIYAGPVQPGEPCPMYSTE